MPNPNDPQYKKVRRKLAKFQSMAQVASLMTDDDTDDLLVEVFNTIVDKHFDEVYDIVTKRQ